MKRCMLLILLASPLAASDVVVCDPANPVVADRVIEYRTSIDTPSYSGNLDALINPDVSAALGVEPLHYWKCDRPGVAAVPMDAGEKAAVDAAENAAADAGVRSNARSSIDGFHGQALILRAIADVLKDEINILRADIETLSGQGNHHQDIPRPARTLAQLKAAIEARVDSGQVD